MEILTCSRFKFIARMFLPCAFPAKLLMLLDADDSLESNETVSLKAESLSGLSVRDSRIAPLESEPLPFPLSDEIEIDEFVTPDIVEFDRECVRPFRTGDMICGLFCCMLFMVLLSVPLAFVDLACCSNKLSSPRIASNSASCVSSKFAIEKRYEFVRSEELWL